MITNTKVTHHAKIFNEYKYGEEECPIVFFATHTCALGQLSCRDYHSLDEIKEAVDWIRKDSKSKNWRPDSRIGGEMAIFTTVCPFENNLRENLKKLKFKPVFNFERRKGYKPGVLEMWTLNL